MLSVLNLRIPLAQLGQAAEISSPSAAIEMAVASGLVDWSPEEPSCPVVLRHPLVRDAIYAGITATRRRALHARAASVITESASWEHRVAALDRPDEGLAAQLEHLAGEEAAASLDYGPEKLYAAMAGPWCARRPAITWAWPTRWATGGTTRPWTAEAGCTRSCGGRC